MIDSHCHLHLCEGETIELLDRAKENGVSKIVQVATNIKTYTWAKDFVEHSSSPIPLYLSLGLYPSEAKDEWEPVFKEVEALFEKDESLVAVGECGLDHYWDVTYNDKQEAMFRAQIELAIRKNKPLIIHCRNAFDDLYRVIDSYSSEKNLKGVWHCFDGELDQGLAMVDKGFFLSLSGIVTFKNSKELQEVVRSLPKESVLIETDSPYLSPAPKRGVKNEPGHVLHVMEYLSALWEIPLAELEVMLDHNTHQLFGLN